MPNIPFNPTIRASGASQVRPVTDRTQQANAIQERATQGLVSATRGAVLAGGKVYVSELEKQFNTDMIAGGAMLDEMKFKRDEEISRIPVSSKVDYDKVAGEIITRYDNEWSQWSTENVRNLNHSIVADMRQTSINAFATDGRTNAETNKVGYENKRNMDQLAMADGIYATQIKRNPNDKQALAGLYRNQDARVIAGFQTEAEAVENKAAIKSRAFKENDSQVKTGMEALVYEGKYEEANELSESFSELMTKDEVKTFKQGVFGASTYNRFNNIANGVRTLEGWDAFDEEVKEDKHMSQDRHKAALDNRSNAGRRKIDTAQSRNSQEIGREAAKGIFDVTDWQIRTGDGSVNGVKDEDGKLGKEYINKASLYISAAQIKEDGIVFDQATKKGGVGKSQYDKLLKFQLNGEMDESEFFDVIEDIRGKGYSEPVRREMERQAYAAFDASLEGGNMEDYDGWFAFGGEPVPAQAQTVYRAFSAAMQKQNDLVGSYVDGAANVSGLQIKVREWVKANPEPSPADTEKFIKSIVEPIEADTRIEARKRF